MKRIALLCLLLVGCAQETTDNNHGYGYSYDVQGQSGIKLRYTPMLDSTDVWASINQYEQAFTQTQACTGITATGPFIILVSPAALPDDAGPANLAGKFLYDPDLILMNAARMDMLRHEMVHYLLKQTGFPKNRNEAHDSDLFYFCDGQH